MFRTIRRSLVILPAALGIVAAMAVPASAAPLSCNAYTGSSHLTTLNICVDVSGTQRAVYVQGATVLPGFSVTLTIGSSDLWQYSSSTGWGDASHDDLWIATGLQTVTYTGTPFTVQFGHLYQACADAAVSMGDVVTDYYNVCSNDYVN